MDDTTFPFEPDRREQALTPGHVHWTELERAEPRLAAAVRARLEATKHHVIATLRADGAPRVSGTEVLFHRDIIGLGSMWHARKALDLRRDGRFALHSNPGDGSMEGGDAKLSGTAVELSGEMAVAIAEQLASETTDGERQEIPEPFHLFRRDLAQVVLSEVDHERNGMVISSWWPDRGLVVTER